MSYELKECIDCHESYEAFVTESGQIAGSGRCPDCTQAHLVKAIPAATATRRFFDKQKMADFLHTSWAQPQICVMCQTPYEAEYHFNIVGQKLDKTEGRCPECLETYQKQKAELERAAKEQAVSGKREEWRRTCGIPPKYQGARFATWETGRSGNVDQIKGTCEQYAEGYPFMTPQEYPSLVLTSPQIWGLGKTHLVCSIAHRILDRWSGAPLRNPITMLTEPELMSRIRATYNQNDREHEKKETEDSVIKHLTWVPLLIIDDLGKYDADSSKFRQGILFRIINGRYNNDGLPMIITANMSDRDFRKHLGGENEAILDRLLEMCRGKFYEVTGRSYRRRF